MKKNKNFRSGDRVVTRGTSATLTYKLLRERGATIDNEAMRDARMRGTVTAIIGPDEANVRFDLGHETTVYFNEIDLLSAVDVLAELADERR